MNENMSIFLATTILALGGLGLYMFKSSDDKQSGVDVDEYDEETLFDPTNSIGSFFSWGSKNDVEDDDKLEEFDEDDYKPRKRGARTLKNRKSSGSSRRRY